MPPERALEAFTLGGFEFVELPSEAVGAGHGRQVDERAEVRREGGEVVGRDGRKVDGREVGEGSLEREGLRWHGVGRVSFTSRTPVHHHRLIGESKKD